jgi:hypothetical protein
MIEQEKLLLAKRVEELEDMSEVLNKQKDRLALHLKSFDENSAHILESDTETMSQLEEEMRKTDQCKINVANFLQNSIEKVT